jgi:hypothetical protein
MIDNIYAQLIKMVFIEERVRRKYVFRNCETKKLRANDLKWRHCVDEETLPAHNAFEKNEAKVSDCYLLASAGPLRALAAESFPTLMECRGV